MNRAVVPVAAAVLLFVLSGCTGGGGDEVNEAVGSPEAASPAVTVSEAPLTAVSPSAAPEAATPEDAFLVKIREVLPDDTSIPDATDGQLLAAAQDACEQMAGGVDSTLVSVIDGEQADSLGYYRDSARIGSVAKQTICP
ncbi:DUF732 domain-containing protein [Microbacterium sp. NPDC089190]|uniref:DUF732 domain-containing protein n=1 Tax=Microbacterium sp. NPDC089190 TaxID=3155063 RepID=UPI00344C30B3